MPELPSLEAVNDLTELGCLAAAYQFRETDLPISFEGHPYTRVVLSRGPGVSLVLICFAPGQMSSIHDHRGSCCVVRVVRGAVLEILFEESADHGLTRTTQRRLTAGAVSGLDGSEIHQIRNLDPAGSVLLNFYSPPLEG